MEVRVNGTWVRGGSFVGRLLLDAWPSEPGTALGTMPPTTTWLDVAPEDYGAVSLKLFPPRRRVGGGGSAASGARGEVSIAVSAHGLVDRPSGIYTVGPGFCQDDAASSPTLNQKGALTQFSRRGRGVSPRLVFTEYPRPQVDACGPVPRWYHAGVSVVYRPFYEPDPPAPVFDRAVLGARPRFDGTRAFATILYATNEDTGYAHGALALLQSLRDAGLRDPFYALLGANVTASVRDALAGAGAVLTEAGPAEGVQASSALPALG